MSEEIVEKVCSKCKHTFPATFEYFGVDRALRSGMRSRCRTCDRAQTQAYRDNNPEKARAQARKWHANNPDKVRELMQAWLDANKATLPERRKAKRQAHLEEAREHERIKASQRREAHPELFREQARARYLANPEKIKEQVRVHRARKLQAPVVDLTEQQWREVLVVFNHRCAYCPPECWRCKQKKHALTQDHITPLVAYGPHTLHNVVPACRSCNSKKGTRAPLKPVQPLLLTLALPKKAS